MTAAEKVAGAVDALSGAAASPLFSSFAFSPATGVVGAGSSVPSMPMPPEPAEAEAGRASAIAATQSASGARRRLQVELGTAVPSPFSAYGVS